jgi:hypothetical protein
MDKIVFRVDQREDIEFEIFKFNISDGIIIESGDEKYSGLRLTFYTKEEIDIADQLGQIITVETKFGDYLIERYRKERNVFYEDMFFYSADTLYWTLISLSGERTEMKPSRIDSE